MKCYMDFDGVLNSVITNPNKLHKMARVTGYNDFEATSITIVGETFPIYMSPTRNARVRELAERTDFVWLTTWQPIGYLDVVQDWVGVEGRVPYNQFTDTVVGAYSSIVVQSWKEKTVNDETNEGTDHFIWCDDEEIRPWYRKRNKDRGRPARLYSPSSRYGLTSFQFDEMFAFLDTHPED